jgi:hypothetical protein
MNGPARHVWKQLLGIRERQLAFAPEYDPPRRFPSASGALCAHRRYFRYRRFANLTTNLHEFAKLACNQLILQSIHQGV